MTQPWRLALIVLLLCGCPSSAPPDSQPPATEVTAETPTSEPPAPAPAPAPTAAPTATATPTASTGGDPTRWIGAWQSAACGDRTYVRTINIATGGSISGAELVSPCPPNVACVWSGILNWRGKYTVEGDTLRLDVAPPPGPAKVKLPSTLSWNDAKGAPAEGACVYEQRKMKSPAPKKKKGAGREAPGF